MCGGADELRTEKCVSTVHKSEQAKGGARTEIVEHVLKEKKECKLRDHGLPRWERHLPSAHAKGLSDGVEEEDLSRTKLTQSVSRSTRMNKLECLRRAPRR